MWADATTLMQQAPMTVSVYLREAVESIDNNFGDGFAKDNPELVAAFIKGCTDDFAAVSVSNALQKISNSLQAFVPQIMPGLSR